MAQASSSLPIESSADVTVIIPTLNEAQFGNELHRLILGEIRGDYSRYFK